MPRKKGRTKAELAAAVRGATSLREVIAALGLVPAGGNYKTVARLLREHEIDTSHFLARAKPLADVLIENSLYQTSRLRERLIESGAFDRRCTNCGLTDWLGAPIPLELEHINGRNDDHRLENLTLLCPNCHALTSTYRGRNKARRRTASSAE